MAFTRFEKSTDNISKLSDRPNQNDGLSSAQLKGRFDKAGNDISEHINEVLIEELESTEGGNSGADQIGATPVKENGSRTVQGVLSELQAQSAAIDNNAVHKTGNETIAGIKTFNGKLRISNGAGMATSLITSELGTLDLLVSPDLNRIGLRIKEEQDDSNIQYRHYNGHYYKMWHEFNDGHNSGLDADLLAGKQARLNDADETGALSMWSAAKLKTRLDLKASTSEIAFLVHNVSFDKVTGRWVFHQVNGSTITIDTNSELLPVNIHLDESTKELVFELDSGQEVRVDVSDLVQDTEYIDTSTIKFTKTHTVQPGQDVYQLTAEVKDGSISAQKLAASVQEALLQHELNAAASATKSESYAVGGTGARPNESTDNAKYYSDRAALAAESLEEIYEDVSKATDEAPTRYSNSLISKASGEVINIPTAESRLLSLRMLGNTTVTPADPANPISPDNPASIVSVAGAVNVLHSGKNLVRRTGTFPATKNGITITYDESRDEYTLNGTATEKVAITITGKDINSKIGMFAPANKYRTMGIWRVSGTNNGNVALYSDSSYIDGAYAGAQITTLNSTIKFAVSNYTRDRDTIGSVGISVDAGTACTNLIVRIGAEINNAVVADMTYEPYKGTTTPIPLKDTSGNPLELRGIPATKDVMDGKNIYSYCKKYAITGAESWGALTDRTNTIKCAVNLSIGQVNQFSNGFNGISNKLLCKDVYSYDVEGYYFSSSQLIVSINKSRLSTADLAGFRAYLTAAEIECWYDTATPQTITLHTDTIAAIEQLYPTHPGRTVLMGTDVVSPGWEVEYVQDINYYAQTQADMAGTLATRPTVGARIGQQYFATDQSPKRVYAWDGSEWIQVK